MPYLIENVGSRTRWKTLSGWLIHVDNTRPHNSECAQTCIKASRAEYLPHPACSPDLALSDFFLFGYIKGNLSKENCGNRVNILNTVSENLARVNREMLLNVFESWVNLPKWVIKQEGRYSSK
jgi:hypothetical protein